MAQPYILSAPLLVTGSQHVIRIADGAHIPVDGANRDYQAFLAWQAEGNSVDPYEAPPAPISLTP